MKMTKILLHKTILLNINKVLGKNFIYICVCVCVCVCAYTHRSSDKCYGEK